MDNSANLGLFAVHTTQCRLRIRRKNLCVHGEDAKRHKTVYISVNDNTNLKFFKILSTTLYGMD